MLLTPEIFFIFVIKNYLSNRYKMTRLTQYTCFDDLKASKCLIEAEKSKLSAQFEMAEFIAFLKENGSKNQPARSSKSINKTTSGK